MELKNLQKHVRTLATLAETDAPIISCYLTLHNGRIKDRIAFDGQVQFSPKVSPAGRGLVNRACLTVSEQGCSTPS